VSEIKWYRRSFIEAMALGCPKQAHECPSVGSDAARFGALGHGLLRDYLGHLKASGQGRDIDYLLEEARKCREAPDLQPAMLSLMKRVGGRIYLPQGRILGIEKDLGWEVMPGIGVACGLDLLLAGIADDELEITDYKFGYGRMTEAEARADFQVRTYSGAVLANYPKVRRVWFNLHYMRHDDPEGKEAYRRVRVDFVREQYEDLEGHVVGALQRCRDLEDDGEFPAVPGYPQCVDCALVMKCPVADECASEIAESPVGFAEHLLVRTAAVAKMKKALKEWVLKKGPVELPGGGRYDVRVSKNTRFDFYKDAGEDDAEDDDEGN